MKFRLHHPDSQYALELKDVSVRYGTRTALDDVSLAVKPGRRVAVVGPNGAGKSTLFNLLAGVRSPDRGRVLIHGHRPERHVCIAYVTQSSQVDWNFPVSVRDVVMMGRVGEIGLLRQPAAADRQLVQSSLEEVEMSHLAARQIGELSGGQKQRMFIARALAQEADLMLLDEPLAGLDLQSQDKIFSLLDTLSEQGVTLLFATHDLNLARERFERILLLNRKLVAYGAPEDVLTSANLSAAYGGHMQVLDTAEGPVAIGDMGGHHEHSHEHGDPHG
jgi:manganese/iron transport system ATP-binding protein